MSNTAELVERNPLAEFSVYETQIVEFQEKAKSIVFDYDDKKGNEDARSYRAKLKKLNPLIDKAHKDEKADILKKGRLLDGEKTRLKGLVSDLVEPVTAALDAVEEKEELRICAHKDKLQLLYDWMEPLVDYNSGFIAELLQRANDFVIDESLEEFQAEGQIAKDKVILSLETSLAQRKKHESEQAELEELRKKEILRKQQDHDNEVARMAEVKAKAKADAKAETDRVAAEQKLQAEKDKKVQAQRELEESKQRVAQAKLDAIEAEVIAKQREEQASIDARKKAEQDQKDRDTAAQKAADAREANKKHRTKINNAAKAALKKAGLTDEQAKAVIVAVARKEIPNMEINY